MSSEHALKSIMHCGHCGWLRAVAIAVASVGVLLAASWIVHTRHRLSEEVDGLRAVVESLGGRITTNEEGSWDVFLDCTKTTDKDMRRISAFDVQVRVLSLRETGLTDGALRWIGRMADVEFLYLDGTEIKGHGLSLLSRLEKLCTLDMRETELDDLGLSRLPMFPRLVCFNLAGTKVTDRGLRHLLKIPMIQGVMLDNTCVTDSGLPQLTEILTLDYVSLTDTYISHDGVKAARECRPDIEFIENGNLKEE